MLEFRIIVKKVIVMAKQKTARAIVVYPFRDKPRDPNSSVRPATLLVREAQTGKYALPGGGVKDGEDPKQAVIREVREELGLDVRPEHMHYAFTYNGNVRDHDVYFVSQARGLGSNGTLEVDYAKQGEVEHLGFFNAGSGKRIPDNLLESHICKQGGLVSHYATGRLSYTQGIAGKIKAEDFKPFFEHVKTGWKKSYHPKQR